MGNGVQKLSTENVDGIQLPFVFLLGLAIVLGVILQRTRFGRCCYAASFNPERGEARGRPHGRMAMTVVEQTWRRSRLPLFSAMVLLMAQPSRTTKRMVDSRRRGRDSLELTDCFVHSFRNDSRKRVGD